MSSYHFWYQSWKKSIKKTFVSWNQSVQGLSVKHNSFLHTLDLIQIHETVMMFWPKGGSSIYVHFEPQHLKQHNGWHSWRITVQRERESVRRKKKFNLKKEREEKEIRPRKVLKFSLHLLIMKLPLVLWQLWFHLVQQITWPVPNRCHTQALSSPQCGGDLRLFLARVSVLRKAESPLTHGECASSSSDEVSVAAAAIKLSGRTEARNSVRGL